MKKTWLILMALTAMARADFALKDGDTVAFLGDSITGARGYTKLVEHYTLMRYPDRKVRFVNAGEGGDTACGSLSRLQQDVFDRGATVVTVAFGINDIGWGTKANDETKAKYLEGIRTIIERCRANRVRPIICSAAITEGDPDAGETGFLQKMNDEAIAMAKSMNVETIDLQRGMREIQRRVKAANATEPDPEKRVSLHTKDGVHLEELGQLAMGFAMLKGLGAPEEVSAAAIDLQNTQVTSRNCRISDLEKSKDGLSFTRLDAGLPLNLGPFTWLQFRWVPLPDLSHYLLTVAHLPEGEYEVRVDGKSIGRTTAKDLAKGLNMASMTANGLEPGSPWEVQSCVVKELVDSRDKLWAGNATDAKFAAAGTPKLRPRIAEIDEQLTALQRAAAKPRAYRFEITKVLTP